MSILICDRKICIFGSYTHNLTYLNEKYMDKQAYSIDIQTGPYTYKPKKGYVPCNM